MTMMQLQSFFGWCAIINSGLFFLAFIFLTIGRNFVYKMHSKFFKISEERLNEIVYSAMIFFKTFLFIFNIVPYIALYIINR